MGLWPLPPAHSGAEFWALLPLWDGVSPPARCLHVCCATGAQVSVRELREVSRRAQVSVMDVVGVSERSGVCQGSRVSVR